MRFLTLALFVVITSTASVNADTTRPSIVNNVQANALSSNSIRVSWNQPWDNVKVIGYNIYRNTQYFATIYNASNYIDQGLQSNKRYEYAVVAFDAARNYSVLSSRAATTTQSSSSASNGNIAAPPQNNDTPNAPSGLQAQAQGSQKIKLSWNKPSGSISGYNLYRNGSYFKTIKGRTDYTAGGLNNGQQYRFQVVAFSGNRYSIKSAEVRATPNGSSNNTAVGASIQNDSGNSAVPSGYKLVFNDEFKSNGIDTSKWNSRYRWGPNWTINGEQQYYIDTINNRNFGRSPFEFDGENLIINATKTPGNLRSKANNKNYLSGALTTYNKFKMRYGYVEMRAQLPKGKGLWPAFWLLHQYENGKRPEIDVVELIGDKPTIAYQTYHYYENWNLRSTPSFEARGPDYSRSFHTYGMKWEPGRITWYVDGRATNTYSNGNVSWEDMYLLVNLAIGGSWAGSPNSSTAFPARFKIDYIRAYQKQ
ncbi:MAG: family 16 glycosylhydrolase [Granulosicoccus sp.]